MKSNPSAMVRRLNWLSKVFPLVAEPAGGAAAEAHPDRWAIPMRLRKDVPADLERAVALLVPMTPMLPADARAAALAVAEAEADCSPAPAA
jgi:hypothetical protein